MAFSGVFRSNLLCLISSPCSKYTALKASLPVVTTVFDKNDSRQGMNYIQCRGKKRLIVIPADFKPIEFRSGDLQPKESPSLHEILFKYKHITEIHDFPKDLQKLFTVAYASEKEKLEHQHMTIQDKVTHLTGPGFKYEKLIAYLTVKIKHLMLECERDRRNKKVKAYTFNRIDKRKKFLNYLKHVDKARFKWLLRELKIDFKLPHEQAKVEKPLTEKAMLIKQAQDELDQAKERKRDALKAMFNSEKAKLMKSKKELLQTISKDVEYEDIMNMFKKEQLKKQREKVEKKVKVGRLFAKYNVEEKMRKERQLKIIPNPYVLGLKRR